MERHEVAGLSADHPGQLATGGKVHLHLSAHLLSITVQVRMNTVQCHASHILRTYMCTEPMAVRPYMSGLYAAVPQWLLGVQYTLWCWVSHGHQSECVGWYKWTPATTAVHNLVR